jgi:acyl-CoA thioesterase I
MADDLPKCIPHDDLVRFHHPLPQLSQALKFQRKIRIVAIGSSSTAGEGKVVPYPCRLEMELRDKFRHQMIDVLNRGIGGTEAPSHLTRFENDVFAEAPALVIWQVGANAIFHRADFNLEDVFKSIETGLRWIGDHGIDAIMMDLQHAPALLDPAEKAKDTRLMVSKIASIAEQAGVNVFRRFALMQHWREVDKIPPELLISDDGLHQTDWSTNCVTHALAGAIMEALEPALA